MEGGDPIIDIVDQAAAETGAEYNQPWQSSQSDGGGDILEFATALLNTAGDVVQVLDKDGNDITNQVGAVQPVPEQGNTLTYMLVGFAVVVLLIIVIMMFKKQ